MTLVDMIKESIQHALENGYDIVNELPVDEAINDLMDYDADISLYPRNEVEEAYRSLL